MTIILDKGVDKKMIRKVRKMRRIQSPGQIQTTNENDPELNLNSLPLHLHSYCFDKAAEKSIEFS